MENSTFWRKLAIFATVAQPQSLIHLKIAIAIKNKNSYICNVKNFFENMTEKIQIVCKNVDRPSIDFKKIEKWIGEVAKSHNRIVGPLTYIFCDDEKIIEVNREFLQHDYYTDIITFDYSRGKLISGDMFISLDTVASNAEMLSVPYLTELHRVIIHGVLHLCGINDKGEGEREIMEGFENEALTLLSDIDV